MTRGIRQEDRLRKRENIINFISKYQPCKYNFLLKNGHFRRNTLRQYLKELEEEKKIVKMDNLYYVSPLSKEQLRNHKNKKKLISDLQNMKKLSTKIDRVLQIIMNRFEKEPIRTILAIKKIQDNSDVVDTLKNNCSDFISNGHHDQLENIKNIDIRAQLSYFSESLKYMDPHIVFELQNDFNIHFKSYPRFEYPRLKHLLHDKEYNPYGIHPKFQKDNSPDLDRLEEVYSNRLCLSSLHVADENNNYVFLYIGDIFGYQYSLVDQLIHDRISETDFKKRYESVTHRHPPKIIRIIPEYVSIEKMLGLELPKGISIDDFKKLLKDPEFLYYFSWFVFPKIYTQIMKWKNK